MKPRFLKIRASYHDYQLKRNQKPPSVPYLPLKGYWLKQAGFEVGQQVRVHIGDQFVFLTLAPDKSH
ncbi:MAG: SymE family type I addiction module toxin [Candidatus Thiodiazotropha sp.]